MLSAPSSATQKKIAAGVSSARDIYNHLEREGFIGDDFPNKLKQKLRSTDLLDHERGLIRHFIARKNSETLLKEPLLWPAELLEEFSDLVSEGDTALSIFVNTDRDDVRDAFIYGVVKGPFISKKEKLAAKAWDCKVTHNRPYTYGFFMDDYQEAKELYLTLLRLIRQYKNDPATVALLAETTEPIQVGQTFTRQVSLLPTVFGCL